MRTQCAPQGDNTLWCAVVWPRGRRVVACGRVGKGTTRRGVRRLALRQRVLSRRDASVHAVALDVGGRRSKANVWRRALRE